MLAAAVTSTIIVLSRRCCRSVFKLLLPQVLRSSIFERRSAFTGAIVLTRAVFKGDGRWQAARDGDGDLLSLSCELIYNLLEGLDVLLCLLWAEKASVIFVRFVSSLRPAIELLEKLHLHYIAWDKRCDILFLAQLGPVDACEPRVLLDFADGLGATRRIFIQQAKEQVDEKDFGGAITGDPNQSKVRWLF